MQKLAQKKCAGALEQVRKIIADFDLTVDDVFGRGKVGGRSANAGTRSRKNFVMRLAVVLSREAKSFLALSSNLISQTKFALHFFQCVSAATACANVDQALLCKIQIFEVEIAP